MTEVLTELASQWDVVTQAPAPIILIIAACIAGTTRIMNKYFRSEVAAAKEHARYMRQRADDLMRENTAFAQELTGLGKDVQAIREQISMQPKIHVGDSPPSSPKIGDLWVDTSEKPEK